MTPEVQRFRNVPFGGFNRRDVTQYIEQTAKAHREQVAELTEKLEQLQREKEELTAALEGLKSESGGLADQEAKVRTSLEESTRSLTRLRGELKTTQTQLAVAKQELAGMQAKVAELEPQAQRYEGLKDRVATVELEAHRKAQAIVDDAQTQADKLREDVRVWLTELFGSYEALRDQIHACAESSAQVSRAFKEREETCQELLRRAGLSATETGAEHD